MKYTPKAIIFGDENGFTQLLREFLFEMGLRETVVAKEAHEIYNYIHEKQWPIVIVNHSEGHHDGLMMFEEIYKTRGLELLPYVFTAPETSNKYSLFAQSIGAKGYISKPLNVQNARKTLRQIIPDMESPSAELAFKATILLLNKREEDAIPLLEQLTKVPFYAKGAEVALIRLEIAKGEFSKAEERLARLMKHADAKIRALCEYTEFYLKRSQFNEAMKIYRTLKEIHPEMNLKVWEQIVLHIELEEIDAAAVLLNELSRDPNMKDFAVEGLARIMIFMGLSEYVPSIAKASPNVAKMYANFVALNAVRVAS